MSAKHMMAAAALLSLVSGPAPGAEPTAAGLWQAIDEDSGQPTGWFLIRDHDGIYDGTIVKMYLKPGESISVVCDRCTDDRHDKPWLGLEIIRGMKRNGLQYEDGSILDPRYGQVYNAMMTLSPDGQSLIVRGYLGIAFFGRNQYWTRLPDSAYSEIDPSYNPNRPTGAAARKRDAASKPQNAARH
ncbi:MAG TPA: DUF2147 domain-containing protein [Xanthobacteraceae bacterium]|nr:DUF2147 domain-containing protein [Xanthobacteraceae bacterium]